MSKGLKSLYTLLGLISLTLLGFVAVISKQHIYLPSFNWLDWDFNLPSPIDVGMYHYFFWGALVLFVIVLLAILVVLFYPRRYTEYKLADKTGKLMLKKSAIEGFVKTEVLKTGLIKSPSVTAHLYKKKVKVDVKGLLTSRTNVPEQLEHIQSDVELGLKEFSGLEKKMNTRVFVKQVEEENVGNAKTNKSRVE